MCTIIFIIFTVACKDTKFVKCPNTLEFSYIIATYFITAKSWTIFIRYHSGILFVENFFHFSFQQNATGTFETTMAYSQQPITVSIPILATLMKNHLDQISCIMTHLQQHQVLIINHCLQRKSMAKNYEN